MEEIQHGIDHVQTDRLILGTLPKDVPLEHHAVMTALSRLTYVDRGDYKEPTDFYEAYSAQYVEKAAKVIADDVAFEVVYSLEHPEEVNNQVAGKGAENATDTVTEQATLSAGAAVPFKI